MADQVAAAARAAARGRGDAAARRPAGRPGRARRRRPSRIVLHSSGTTSAPKGVAHSSNTLRYAAEGVCRRWGLTGDDIYLTVVEFGFVGGLVFGYLPVLLNGATGVLLDRWNAEDALRLIEEHGCTYVLAMPTHGADMIRAAEQTDRDLSSMRILAGPGLTPERRVAMRNAFGTPPLGDYGLSEVPGHAAHAPDDPEEKILRTEGRPVRRDGDPDPRRGRGAAAARQGRRRWSSTVRAASSASSTTTSSRRESLTEWGGYRTGDLGVLDEDGHFVYVGRSKDIIRRGGVTIVPAEVEPVHPAPPGRSTRSRSCRFRTTASASALARRSSCARAPPRRRSPTCRPSSRSEGVAKYTWPESVEVFENFPRTPSLKVVKRDVVTAIARALARHRVT